MPTYQFYCDPDEKGCGNLIEVTCSFSDKDEKIPKSCHKCKKRKALRELFGYGSTINIPKTLGSYADKKTSKLSKDEKQHMKIKQNEYKEKAKDVGWVDTDKGLIRTRK